MDYPASQRPERSEVLFLARLSLTQIRRQKTLGVESHNSVTRPVPEFRLNSDGGHREDFIVRVVNDQNRATVLRGDGLIVIAVWKRRLIFAGNQSVTVENDVARNYISMFDRSVM